MRNKGQALFQEHPETLECSTPRHRLWTEWSVGGWVPQGPGTQCPRLGNLDEKRENLLHEFHLLVGLIILGSQDALFLEQLETVETPRGTVALSGGKSNSEWGPLLHGCGSQTVKPFPFPPRPLPQAPETA